MGQSVFQSTDPEYIAETLITEANNAAELLVTKTKLQKKKFTTPYWNKKLEAQLKAIKHMNRVAAASKKDEDARRAKNLKNQHIKELKRAEKCYYENKLQTNLGKWKTVKEIETEEEQTLITANVNGKPTSSPKNLADAYSEASINRINN